MGVCCYALPATGVASSASRLDPTCYHAASCELVGSVGVQRGSWMSDGRWKSLGLSVRWTGCAVVGHRP